MIVQYQARFKVHLKESTSCMLSQRQKKNSRIWDRALTLKAGGTPKLHKFLGLRYIYPLPSNLGGYDLSPLLRGP